MKIIKYNSVRDVIVQFQDEWKECKKVTWQQFCNGEVRNPHIDKSREGIIKTNFQNSEMKIIKYISATNILVEFQDKYHYKRKATWQEFNNGSIKNLYFPTVCGVGIVGEKYPTCIDEIDLKEYTTWRGMLRRCYDGKHKMHNPAYKDVTCCDEWLLYEIFYEWLHSQENFDKWYNNDKWALDKDILIKGNKIYSPNTCCLVPIYINSLFTKNNAVRGNLPIGVRKDEKRQGYSANIIYGMENNRAKNTVHCYPTPEDAFYLGYKPSKENYIKRVAQEEYNKGNITKKCYEAMMNYQVEITD